MGVVVGVGLGVDLGVGLGAERMIIDIAKRIVVEILLRVLSNRVAVINTAKGCADDAECVAVCPTGALERSSGRAESAGPAHPWHS